MSLRHSTGRSMPLSPIPRSRRGLPLSEHRDGRLALAGCHCRLRRQPSRLVRGEAVAARRAITWAPALLIGFFQARLSDRPISTDECRLRHDSDDMIVIGNVSSLGGAVVGSTEVTADCDPNRTKLH